MGRQEGRRTLGRPRHKFQNGSLRIQLGRGGVDSIDLAQYSGRCQAHVNTR